MGFLGNIAGMLQQYASGGQPGGNVEDHFDQVGQAVPSSSIADGLSAAFRSDKTPPFAQMAGQLFDRSNGQQQASVLNELIATAGPSLLSSLSGGGGGLGSILGGSGLGALLGGAGASGLTAMLSGRQPITAEQASQVPPEVVTQLAAHAEKQDPSIVDRMSSIYAEHPGLIKTLGSAALTIALAKIAERHGA